MAKNNLIKLIDERDILEKIHIIRGQKVMLDNDLAELYAVGTKVLNQAVRRNPDRFPGDFMFELTRQEREVLRSQIVTLEKGRGKHSKFLPKAFTEQGIAMLSSVLRSDTAIQVNIRIIRVYTRMRQVILDNRELWKKIELIEKRLLQKDNESREIFEVLKQLIVKEKKPRQTIGFKLPKRKQHVRTKHNKTLPKIIGS